MLLSELKINKKQKNKQLFISKVSNDDLQLHKRELEKPVDKCVNNCGEIP